MAIQSDRSCEEITFAAHSLDEIRLFRVGLDPAAQSAYMNVDIPPRGCSRSLGKVQQLATREHMQRLFHEGHQQSKLRRAEIDQYARRCMNSPPDNIEPPASEREDAIGTGSRCASG